MKIVIILPVIAFFIVIVSFPVQDAYAVNFILDVTTCFPKFGGLWNGITNTCTVSSGVGVIGNGDEIVIPSGTNLVITNSGKIQINDPIHPPLDGKLTNYGKIIISTDNSVGIDNANGTLTNYGTITVSNSVLMGIFNEGATLINSGAITISNSGKSGVYGIWNFGNSANITNSGTIKISNSAGYGLLNDAAILTNSGTIQISNTGNSDGVITSGYFTNSGTITISNTGGIGIATNDSGLSFIINFGTIYNCGGTTSGTIPTYENPIVACPNISINDVLMTEGTSGTKNFVFTVTRSGNTTGVSSVNFTTADGTATISNSDYSSKSGTLNFTANQTTKTITILVNGDTLVESSETFYVNLSNCVGCNIVTGQGVGTILDDDTLCSLPVSGEWTITSNCTLASTSTAPANVIISKGAVLTIPNGVTLTIHFKTNHLIIHHGGGVLIKSGGKMN